nr:sodium channel protein Nach-like [Aedes albopictus]
MRWFRKKSKSPSKTIFNEYCATSSVHGVRYFSDPERTMCEKFWWIVMFLVSVGGCVKLIGSTWQKWNLTPIVVNYENQPISITEIPFPSITICPPGRISKSMYNFGKEANQIRQSGAYENA